MRVEKYADMLQGSWPKIHDGVWADPQAKASRGSYMRRS